MKFGELRSAVQSNDIERTTKVLELYEENHEVAFRYVDDHIGIKHLGFWKCDDTQNINPLNVMASFEEKPLVKFLPIGKNIYPIAAIRAKHSCFDVWMLEEIRQRAFETIWTDWMNTHQDDDDLKEINEMLLARLNELRKNRVVVDERSLNIRMNQVVRKFTPRHENDAIASKELQTSLAALSVVVNSHLTAASHLAWALDLLNQRDVQIKHEHNKMGQALNKYFLERFKWPNSQISQDTFLSIVHQPAKKL